MGRLEDKLEKRKKVIPQLPVEEENVSNTEIPPEVLPEQEEYYRRKQSLLSKMKIGQQKKLGFTKDAYSMATAIEQSPTKEGLLKKTFFGRPIDLHMLEDYLLWRTSPLAIKTILRYEHAKNIEDMRGLLSTTERARGNPKMLIIVVLAIILLVGGIIFLLYGPQLLSMFQP